MTSSSLDLRRRTYVRLIGEIQHALNDALAEEFARRGLTRTQMADILHTNKSFVTRKLSGVSNMTLETLADLAFALDRAIKIQLISRAPVAGANYLVETAPTHVEVASGRVLSSAPMAVGQMQINTSVA